MTWLKIRLISKFHTTYNDSTKLNFSHILQNKIINLQKTDWHISRYYLIRDVQCRPSMSVRLFVLESISTKLPFQWYPSTLLEYQVTGFVSHIGQSGKIPLKFSCYPHFQLPRQLAKIVSSMPVALIFSFSSLHGSRLPCKPPFFGCVPQGI